MSNRSWLQKNWLLVGGLSFLGIHLGTYLMQKIVKSSTRSDLALKQKDVK